MVRLIRHFKYDENKIFNLAPEASLQTEIASQISEEDLEFLLPSEQNIETPDIIGGLQVTFVPHDGLKDLDDFKFNVPPLALKRSILIKDVISEHVAQKLGIPPKYIKLSCMFDEARPTDPVKPNSSYGVSIKDAYRVRAFWQDSAIWYDASLCETVESLKNDIIAKQTPDFTPERLILIHKG